MSEELRKSFNSGKSKTFEWRKETLEKLKSAILSYREKVIFNIFNKLRFMKL